MIYTVTLNPSIDRTLYFARLVLGQVNRAVETRTDLGGKGVNVSRALQQMRWPSGLLGFAGGMLGEQLIEGLQASGLQCAFTRIKAEMRSNITAVDQELQSTTKLNEPGPSITAADLARFKAGLVAHLQTGDLVAFCGSLPAGAPADTYARFIQAAHQAGASCALDTSGEALALGCRAKPEWVKPNLEEAVYLTSCDLEDAANWPAAIAQIQATGVEYVLLSAGARGLVLAHEKEMWLAWPPENSISSTVGAGDAALAGALYSWQMALPLRKIVRWAAAAGTAAAMLPGTQMPTMDNIQAVYPHIQTRLLQ